MGVTFPTIPTVPPILSFPRQGGRDKDFGALVLKSLLELKLPKASSFNGHPVKRAPFEQKTRSYEKHKGEMKGMKP